LGTHNLKYTYTCVDYQLPWRYYYTVRNSPKLLIEGMMDFTFYRWQLISWGIRILLTEGAWRLIKPLGPSIIHAILNKLGYIEPRAFA